MSQFAANIEHISGSENSVANVLSCTETNALTLHPSPIDFKEIAIAQKDGKELKQFTVPNSSQSQKLRYIQT